MGCGHSKQHKTPNNKRPSPPLQEPQDDSSTVIVASPEQEDERRIASLRRDFSNNLEQFVLNNVLMSVMFFENFDREMQRVANVVSKKEESLRLMTEHKKQCIMPDVVFDGVNHMVRFRRRHGPKKYMEESLIPQRMFIVFETVEILQETEDLGHYAGIDKPTHRAYIENSNHSGFVKLNHVEYLNTKLQNGMTSNSSTNSGESSDAYMKTMDECPSPVSDSKPSTSYSTDVEDSEIEYGRINEARVQRPLSLQNIGRSYSGGLPPNCIREVRMKNLALASGINKNLYINQQYLVSNEFMAHFRDAFSGMLGEALGFSIEEIQSSTFNTFGIFCETTDEYGRLIKCEVVPAVLNPWPDLLEWADRERTTVFDRLTSMRYVWPSPKMVEEIKTLPSLTIPRGFLPKKELNTESDLEWEVAFPKAEKYLHTRMSHAQMRCFLFVVTLYKTFIEPITDKKGLLVDHIRTLIFWECEKNYWQWLDDKLGAKLIKILDTLYNHLAVKTLPDYFVPEKNLFENIPSKYLVTAQQHIHDIKERPVAHFLCALRNLTYPSERFYPSLDFDKLHSMLYAKNAMKMINPDLFEQTETDREQASKQHKKKLTDAQIWEKKKLDETRKRKQEQKNMKKQQENTNLNSKPRESKDSIDLMQKIKADDELRPVVIIPFFIDHYIKIAEVSTRYSNKNQALFYLKNAYYLSKVLETVPSGQLIAQEWQQKIKHTEDMCKRYSTMEVNALNVPLRNSSILGTSMQLKTKTVDMNNLSHAKNMPVNDIKSSQKKTWTELNMTTDSTKPTKKGIKSARFSTVVDINHISTK